MARTKRAQLLDSASSRAAARDALREPPPANTHPRALAFAVATAFVPWFVPTVHAQIAADTLPTGGQVGAGAASISTSGSKMQIDQATQRAILNWERFSIGSSAWVNFTQPGASAVALNRVVGNDPSHIFGRLTANGQVFLVNNAGVFFAPGASVDVGGLFATSLSINDHDFLAGRYQFFNPGNAGKVVNQGDIVTANGYTALVGPQVRNDGVIAARKGSVVLAAADRVMLDMVGDGLISISVDRAALNASVINTGRIEADGGTVLLAARSANALLDTVINNSGIIRANSLRERDGEIVLDGGSAGVVANSGTLQAAGVDADTTGGTVKVLGHDVRLMAGARLDATGLAGGGTVLVGGNFQGRGPEANASRTYIDADASVIADAVTSGNGGTVIVWADQDTYFFGHISARGGAASGDGGFVEVSGKSFLAFRGTADRRAPKGQAGTLLLDPTDMTITAAAGDVVCPPATCTSNSTTSTLSTADLQGALTGGDVVVDATAGGGAGGGTINWTDGTVDASANSLTLVGTSITFDGTLTNLDSLTFSSAPTGTGTATSSTNGSIGGIGSLTFALSGLNVGNAGGITFSGFGAADSTTVTGASGFDDAARSSLGMTFANANSVSGSATITGVAGGFDDASLTSANSGIAYSGFNAVSGTGTALTGVDISFDDTTRVSGSGVAYNGLTNLATVSGAAPALTGVDISFDDTSRVSGSGINYSGLGSLATVSGSATSLAGVATSFNDATQVSGSGINYGGLGSLATVAGDGTATITGVVGSFDDATLVSAASSIDYSGFNAVSGTGTALTGVNVSFNDTTRVSGSGVDYSGLTNLATVSGSATSLTGIAATFNDATQVSGSGIDYGGLASLATVAGDGTATITGVTGSFDDAPLVSAASSIDYSSFNAVSGTGTALTGVNVSFNDTTRFSGSGVDYSGLTNLATVSGNASSLTGVNISFNDTTQVSGSGIDYGGLASLATVSGNATSLTGVNIGFNDTTQVSGSGVDYGGLASLATVSGSATSLTGVATSFDDATQVSGSGINYGGLGSLATVAGDGTATITGVVGSFDDATLVSAASGIDYSGFNAVSGTGGVVSNVTANFSLDTHVSAASGVNYSGFGLGTVAGTGGGTITGSGRTYNVTGANAGNDGTVFWTNFSSLSDAGGGTFNITTGSLGGTIAGGTGGTLSYAGNAGPVSVNLQTGSASSVTGGITGINNLIGSGSAGDTLAGTNAGTTWTINGANDGTLSTGFTFANFANLVGGSASDNFVLSGGTVSGAINGGGGSDVLAGSTSYSISGPNAGSASGIASFTNIETLTGTGGNDSFTLAVASFNGTINGGAGTDTLVGANVVNNWVLTSVGNGTLNTTTTFMSIETMVGGTNTDNLSGTAIGGTTTMIDPTSLVVASLNASGGVVNLTAGSLSGAGVISAGSGTFASNTNVVGLGINVTNNLLLTGAATLWNFSAGSSAGSFSVTSQNTSVQVAGVTFIASLAQQQGAAAIGTVAEQVGAVIVEEANKTFGTDSVAQDVEYGFAGEIGTTPPMDHRIDESGISLPRCVEEAREGLPCK